jgi:hypothetical protein
MLKRLGLSLLVLGCAGLVFWLWPQPSSHNGSVTLKIMDQGVLVREVDAELFEDDVLFDVLERHFDLVCATPGYSLDDSCQPRLIVGRTGGRVLLGIDDLRTDWFSDFLQIRRNGSPAQYGVDTLSLEDGDTVTIDRITVSD